MKTPLLVLSSLLACLAATPFAHADSILLGTTNAPSNIAGFAKVSSGTAEGFFLTKSVTLTSINIGLFSDTGYSTDVFEFQIANLIGPDATAANILGSFYVPRSEVAVSPCDPPGCAYLTISTPPLTLNPGEYFLVGTEVYVNDVTEAGAAWGNATSILPSSVGAIGPLFYATSFTGLNLSNPANSNWIPDTTGNVVNLQLLGHVNIASEPATIALFAIGFIAILLLHRRKTTANRRTDRQSREHT